MHEIIPGLWQGSLPYIRRGLLRKAGFDLAVFCAIEYRPDPEDYPVPVVAAALEDRDPLTQDQVLIARRLGKLVAEALNNKKKVLVTCMAGLNRSGLINALAIHELTGAAGFACMERVQRCRPNALFNKAFQAYLMKLPSKKGMEPNE